MTIRAGYTYSSPYTINTPSLEHYRPRRWDDYLQPQWSLMTNTTWSGTVTGAREPDYDGDFPGDVVER